MNPSPFTVPLFACEDLQTGEEREVQIERIDRPELFKDEVSFSRSMSPDGKHLADRSAYCAFVFATDTGKQGRRGPECRKDVARRVRLQPRRPDVRRRRKHTRSRQRRARAGGRRPGRNSASFRMTTAVRCGSPLQPRREDAGARPGTSPRERVEICLFDVPSGRVRMRTELERGTPSSPRLRVPAGRPLFRRGLRRRAARVGRARGQEGPGDSPPHFHRAECCPSVPTAARS